MAHTCPDCGADCDCYEDFEDGYCPHCDDGPYPGYDPDYGPDYDTEAKELMRGE